jgi:hypothetical protein
MQPGMTIDEKMQVASSDAQPHSLQRRQHQRQVSRPFKISNGLYMMMLAGDLDLGIATTTRKRILRKPSCPDERSPHSEISVAQNKHPTTLRLRLRNRGNPAEIHRQPELRKNLNLIRAINLLNAPTRGGHACLVAAFGPRKA